MTSPYAAAVIGLFAIIGVTNAARAQGPGSVFKDCADCPEMVVIPGGSFMMGSQSVPAVRFEAPRDEQPRHQVNLRSFALGKYEVTQAQWQSLMGANPSATINPALPVEKVSWSDIQVFIQKLNSKTGRQYRLPSEAEWEYAARAGSTTLYSFGDDAGQLDRFAWYGANAGGRPHPVGQKQANPYGLHDMHGNVWEWVQDCHKEDYRGTPSDGTAFERSGLCVRVLRGGSWYFPAEHLRSAYRSAYLPGFRYFDVGFRLAASLP